MIPALGPIDPLTAARLADKAPVGSETGSVAGAEGGFGTVLGETLGQTVERLENAEELSVQALKGDADVRQVVDAVMEAEQTLQTAISIRDKIVTAYLEISRMTI